MACRAKPDDEPKYNEAFFRSMGGPGRPRSGIVVVLLIIVGIYLAFAKRLPFTSPGYELKATFANAVRISNKAPVRIAGVNVGQVTGVERKGNARSSPSRSRTRAADPRGRLGLDPAADLPRGQLLPRRRPGQPERARAADNGDDPGHAHLDRGPARPDADRAAEARARQPPAPAGGLRHGAHLPADAGRGQDPGSRRPGRERRDGAQPDLRLRRPRPAAASAIVNEALLGTEPDDLSQLLVGGNRIFKTLASREVQLQGLITNFNTFTGALAAQSGNLSERSGCWRRPSNRRRSLVDLNAALPALRGYAIAARPGIAELPATIKAGLPWLKQAKPLLSKRELGGIASLLAAARRSSTRRPRRPSACCRS